MTLLKPATIELAFAKLGLLGFPGSGKTHTAFDVALGLARHPSSQGRPIAFFDTEGGSDFWIDRVQEAGVGLNVAKSRSFRDLLAVVEEAEKTHSVLVIDSITHVWTELLDAFKKQFRRQYGLQFQDWGTVKGEWARFTTAYLNANLHIILCGRAGYEYETTQDEDGKKELNKVGTKMKAETDMGYEPSLLIEMVRIKVSEQTHDVKDKGWIHRAYVLKDRFDVINGEEFDNPTFESFLPHIGKLNLGGVHRGVDAERSSVGMFDSPESLFKRKQAIEITLELIQDSMIEGDIGGTSKEAKAAQVKHLNAAFGTSSWTAIKGSRLEEMQAGLHKLRANLMLESLVETDADPEPESAPAEVEG